ncbi:hypothetical protein [Limnoglobus roseus]|uniref:Uncharacterized protein n=1 Tax=Limnoglobus roseus TaxID=2598579 RepID=A0A5C1AHS0_9BACT|nr:hypothetical protein [Limnoglobus roseus]QEL17546.1 hypothetical protein PX52LOC_04536 [Limnoglobus roseus]
MPDQPDKVPLGALTASNVTEDEGAPAGKKTQRRGPRELETIKRLRLINDRRQLNLDQEKATHQQLIQFRKDLCQFAMRVVLGWQLAILAIVVWQGNGLLTINHHVLLALITTTTINVFAFLIIVMKFVFPSPASEKTKTKTKKKKQRVERS